MVRVCFSFVFVVSQRGTASISFRSTLFFVVNVSFLFFCLRSFSLCDASSVPFQVFIYFHFGFFRTVSFEKQKKTIGVWTTFFLLATFVCAGRVLRPQKQRKEKKRKAIAIKNRQNSIDPDRNLSKDRPVFTGHVFFVLFSFLDDHSFFHANWSIS